MSEIVGSLMLVLIVVAAATSIAVFVASYQKQLQAEQKLAHDRALESLHILRATPTLNTTAGTVTQINFTLASLYINPSTVTQIRINDNPLRQYHAWRLDLTSGTYGWVTIASGGQLTLQPREQLNVLVNVTGSPNGSFYNSSFTLSTTGFLKIEAITVFQNDFSRVFLPPTAIALVTTLQSWNGTAYVPVTVLDASMSFQPGNSTLVAWSWNVTPDNSTLSGEKAVVSFNPSFLVHHIRLTVTNSDGLLATETLRFP